jgi:cellulose synthase/poly-beta-1,6-N-acetylglucosamine synthase-like glycosyltransferase
VSVIVPARDAAATIGRCLEALAQQDARVSFEVLVCDDGSSDATAQIAAGFGPPVRVVHADGHGAASARNAGVASAEGAVLAFTDADCFPAAGWLAAGLRAMHLADVVQGPIRPDPATPRGPFDRTLHRPGPSAWFATANLFARRAAVLEAGGFPTVALLATGGRRQPLGEDTVLAWRVLRAGARTAFAPEAVVHHAVFPASAVEYVRYRTVWRALPAVVRDVPELRRELLFGRVFLEQRTALFDLAVAGLAVALVPGPRRASACALPYALFVAREAVTHRSAGFAAARVAADAVACGALVAGSVRARTLVI